MRKILFRGKRLDNGEWVEGNLFVSDTDGGTYILAGSRIVTIEWEVDPSTVGQYTGLKDKNGKRIFEEDIIKTRKSGIRTEKRKGYYGYDSEGYPQKLPGYNGFYEYKYTCQIDCYAEVKYDKVNGGFYLKGSDMFVSATCNEVMGNIYDNQELISLNGVHKE